MEHQVSYTINDLDEAIENGDTEWEGCWNEFHYAAGSKLEQVFNEDGTPKQKTVTYQRRNWQTNQEEDVSYETNEYRDKGWVGVDLPGFGRASLVSQHGGEGQGDDYHIVFTVTDDAGNVRTFKRNGYHASHDGSYLDGPTEEVKPVEKVVTVWESI
jgi:hypothetical protein